MSEMCLVVGKVGSNISQRGDGQIAGKKYYCENGYGVLQNKFPKGSECEFNDKTVPCLVCWSPSRSITSKILADCLTTMDYYDLFARMD